MTLYVLTIKSFDPQNIPSYKSQKSHESQYRHDDL